MTITPAILKESRRQQLMGIKDERMFTGCEIMWQLSRNAEPSDKTQRGHVTARRGDMWHMVPHSI